MSMQTFQAGVRFVRGEVDPQDPYFLFSAHKKEPPKWLQFIYHVNNVRPGTFGMPLDVTTEEDGTHVETYKNGAQVVHSADWVDVYLPYDTVV